VPTVRTGFLPRDQGTGPSRQQQQELHRRAPEIGRANGADGICQRAAGEPPWGPPAPNFVTFPMPAAGPLVALETSAGGAGAVHIDFSAATILDETQFDVMFRLVDSLTTPTVDLRTGCSTVTVR
jgi:hypothetical protein